MPAIEFRAMDIDTHMDNFRPFPTGSVIYGTPHEKSDLDVCVLLNEVEYDRLFSVVVSEGSFDTVVRPPADYRTRSFRLGGLNLICTTNPKFFQVWKQATLDLLRRSPVTREEAVNHFTKLEQEAGMR